jgi:hypothetical protein
MRTTETRANPFHFLEGIWRGQGTGNRSGSYSGDGQMRGPRAREFVGRVSAPPGPASLRMPD